jgi:hypothetical protein
MIIENGANAFPLPAPQAASQNPTKYNTSRSAAETPECRCLGPIKNCHAYAAGISSNSKLNTKDSKLIIPSSQSHFFTQLNCPEHWNFRTWNLFGICNLRFGIYHYSCAFLWPLKNPAIRGPQDAGRVQFQSYAQLFSPKFQISSKIFTPLSPRRRGSSLTPGSLLLPFVASSAACAKIQSYAQLFSPKIS